MIAANILFLLAAIIYLSSLFLFYSIPVFIKLLSSSEQIVNMNFCSQINKEFLLCVRRALHRIAFLIIDSLHCHRYILSVRFHDLDRLTYGEFISLCDLREATFEFESG